MLCVLMLILVPHTGSEADVDEDDTETDRDREREVSGSEREEYHLFAGITHTQASTQAFSRACLTSEIAGSTGEVRTRTHFPDTPWFIIASDSRKLKYQGLCCGNCMDTDSSLLHFGITGILWFVAQAGLGIFHMAF